MRALLLCVVVLVSGCTYYHGVKVIVHEGGDSFVVLADRADMNKYPGSPIADAKVYAIMRAGNGNVVDEGAWETEASGSAPVVLWGDDPVLIRVTKKGYGTVEYRTKNLPKVDSDKGITKELFVVMEKDGE